MEKNITFLDNIDVMNCANFGTSVTSALYKNRSKQFDNFSKFLVFGLYVPQKCLEI